MSTRTEQGFELRGPVTPIPKLVKDIWRQRGLLRMLSRRDFYVRYRRPTFGILWALALPLMNAVVLAVVFSLVVKVKTPVNYPTFVMSGVLPWVFFSSTVATASTSITNGASIASKVYFPRAILPLVTMLANFYGFIPGLGLLVVFALIYHVHITLWILVLIPAVLVLVIVTSAFSLLFAAVHVYFRDVGFIVQASIQAWFYASAVFYPISLAPKLLQRVIELNPATGMIQLFRTAMFGTPPDALALIAIVGWVVALVSVALLLYRRYDRVFVDLL